MRFVGSNIQAYYDNLHQRWGTCLLPWAGWSVYYRWRAAKSLEFVLTFCLCPTMRKSDFLISCLKYLLTVGYLGFPAPGGKLSFARSWQRRCEAWVGNKGASKADSGPAFACIYLFLHPSENFLWLWRHRIDATTFESWKSLTIVDVDLRI